MKHKVGIVTIQSLYNYGNRLQNYATTQIYKSYGFDAESLNFEVPHIDEIVKILVKKAVGQYRPPRETTISADRLNAFVQFNQLMNIRSIKSLRNFDQQSYEYFSVGSDQIWAMSGNRADECWQFLQFASPEQCIALAPSFGVSSIDDKKKERLALYLKRYSHLSVREEGGASLIKDVSGREAQVVCDPTMVLQVSDWRKVSDDRLTPSRPYVFAYILGTLTDEANSALKLATMDGKLPVVMLSDRGCPNELPAGPAEFISLLENSEHVVTDSFHGSVFAAIFQRPLTIVHRAGGSKVYSQMFGRLETLSVKLGIQEKIFATPSFDFRLAGDYSGVQHAIGVERAKFLTYLEGCLYA